MRLTFQTAILFVICVSANASIITVNTSSMVESDDGNCSLPEAISSANNNSSSGQMPGECVAGETGFDEIVFNLPQSMTVIEMANQTFPSILEDLQITGPGQDLLTINAQQFSHIFGIRAAFHLSGITLLNGEGTTGASLYQFSAHDLTLTDCVIEGSSVSDSGGAIRVLGGETSNEVLIERCDFIDNDAGNHGGAIHASAVSGRSLSLKMQNVQFIDNQSHTASGGALTIVSNGTGQVDFELDNLFFTNNEADINGGAVEFDGSGITGIIKNSSFYENFSGISGGAVMWIDTGDIYSVNNTFYRNTAQKFAGAVYANADQNISAQITLVNNSIIQNTVATGVSNAGGGGIYSQNDSTLIKNTLIAENLVINGGTDCGGSITSMGYNFISDGTDCNLISDSSDMIGSSGNTLNPLLSYVISPVDGVYAIPNINSPLINAGDPLSCDNGLPFTIEFDQIGHDRHQDPLDENQFFGRCDIGSIEVQSPDLIFYSGFENSAT